MNLYICLSLLSLFLFVSGYYQYEYPNKITTDDLKELKNELFINRKYDKTIRPIPKTDQLRVSIMYKLIKISDMDLKSQTLTTDGWLIYNWNDENFIWNNTKWQNIDHIHIPPNDIFIPDILVYNRVDYKHKNSLQTNTLVFSNGAVMWVPPFTSKALCKFDLTKWPYDEHICSLKFGSWTYNGWIMDVRPDNNNLNRSGRSFLDDYFQSPEFDVSYLNTTYENKYYPCCKEPYPSVTFFFKLERKPTLYNYVITMPSVVAIISCLITFWFPIRSTIRFVLNGFSLLVMTLILLHLSTHLGLSSFGVPISVRFLGLTTLLIGIIQIWFTISYNMSMVKWNTGLIKSLAQIYRNSESETNQLTQNDDSTERRLSGDVMLAIDKIVFIVLIVGIISIALI